MTLEDIAAIIIGALQEADLPFMVVGGLSCNVYSIPRSTKDVDIVIKLESAGQLQRVNGLLPEEFHFDPQITFESITGSIRHIIRIEGTPFVIELFELREADAFQFCRFERRRVLFLAPLKLSAPIPTAEDVIVQKLRWGRPKDLDDVRGVLSVQGSALDFSYIEDWCRKLEILDRYESVRSTVPEI
jgi:hypothetical protein